MSLRTTSVNLLMDRRCVGAEVVIHLGVHESNDQNLLTSLSGLPPMSCSRSQRTRTTPVLVRARWL
jgi:hypothetical protein